MKKIFTTLKKIIKKYFLVFLLVMVFVLSSITSSYGAFYDDTNNYEQDPTIYFNMRYNNIVNNFLKYCIACYNNDSYKQDLTDMANLIINGHNYYIEQNGSTSFVFHLITSDEPYSTSSSTISFESQTIIPIISGSYWQARQYTLDWTSSTSFRCVRTNTTGTYTVPVNAIGNYNELFYGWCQQITGHSELNSVNTNLQLLLTTIQVTNDKLNELNNDVNSIDSSINNDDVSGISTDIIQDNPLQKGETEGFFEGFYQSVVVAFTDTSERGVVLPLGFVDRNIIIRGDLLSSQLSRFTDSSPSILDIIHLFWYFTFGIYIFKDIQKYKDDFKSGEVLNKTDTNITTEML